MEHNIEIDMDSSVHKFCVSWFTLRVANVGTSFVVRSWNEHRIPGKYAESIILNIADTIGCTLFQERVYLTDGVERRTLFVTLIPVIYPLLMMLSNSFHQWEVSSLSPAHLEVTLWQRILLWHPNEIIILDVVFHHSLTYIIL